MRSGNTNADNQTFTNIIFVLFGVLGIAIAVARLGNDIEYLPGDVRSQPWFDPLVSLLIAAVSLFFLVVGALRLWFAHRRGNNDGK